MNPNLSLARAVADAVLYEGYLLYPYRASATKNQSRWQFGVLGPRGASEAGVGEEASMWTDCMVRDGDDLRLEIYLRFLQLQRRTVARVVGMDYVDVEQLTIGSSQWTSWDEATEHEELVGVFDRDALIEGLDLEVGIDGGEDIEDLVDDDGHVVGRVVRRREPLRARFTVTAHALDGFVGLTVRIDNVTADDDCDKESAIARSLIGTHLLLASSTDFVSMVDPPAEVKDRVDAGVRHRCWPVLAGPEGHHDVLLISPIILYDHPAVAPESSVALFDSTEIDEILTLRVLTLTDEEKAEARRTDPRAAEIIDRCENMTPHEMQQLHGTLRDPRSFGQPAAELFTTPDFPEFSTPDPDAPWWDPEVDGSVRPDVDSVVIDGVTVAKDSIVTIRPNRRADAQDLFSAGREARVTGVHFDVDGSTHVAVVLLDDPAADLHEWYGRFLYFAPDELVPAGPDSTLEAGKSPPGRKVL
ncbi:MAG: hypothetical protein M3Q98_07860 [Actinomycetota bacterium]|nr:hypothetical protein [Actinomycetota bacterium]